MGGGRILSATVRVTGRSNLWKFYELVTGNNGLSELLRDPPRAVEWVYSPNSGAGQGSAGQCRAGRGRAGQGGAGHGSSGGRRDSVAAGHSAGTRHIREDRGGGGAGRVGGGRVSLQDQPAGEVSFQFPLVRVESVSNPGGGSGQPAIASINIISSGSRSKVTSTPAPSSAPAAPQPIAITATQQNTTQKGAANTPPELL